MLAISLIQPFAWLVTAGPKRIENRTWALHEKVIGQRVLIHASKTDPEAYGDIHAFLRERGLEVRLPKEAFSVRGGIVGWVRIAGSLKPGRPPPPEAAGYDLRWWMRDQHGFLLSEAGVMPFQELRGKPSFFEVGDVQGQPAAVQQAPSPQLSLFGSPDEPAKGHQQKLF